MAQPHLVARIVKPAIFRMLFNALKDMLREITLEIGPRGISCTYYDQNNALYCLIDLDGDKFDEYLYDAAATTTDPGFAVSFNVINLVKILKGVSVKDLNFTMDITPTSFAVEIQQSTASRLFADIDLIERSSLHIQRPDLAAYPVILDLNMKEFQTTVAQMKTVCHTTPRFQSIDVVFYRDKLTYTVPHNMYGSEIRIEKSVAGVTTTTAAAADDSSGSGSGSASAQMVQPAPVDKIFAYKANLQFLINLTKTGSMSPNVYMYIANDQPIFFEYMIGTVGKLVLGINPNELQQ